VPLRLGALFGVTARRKTWQVPGGLFGAGCFVYDVATGIMYMTSSHVGRPGFPLAPRSSCRKLAAQTDTTPHSSRGCAVPARPQREPSVSFSGFTPQPDKGLFVRFLPILGGAR
jgi:hypothetical protein